MATAVVRVPARSETLAAPIGISYHDVSGHGSPLSVTAVPGATGTLNLAFSTTKGAASLGAAAVWIAWTPGAVAAATREILQGPISGIRATAATAAGAVEVLG